MGLAGMEERVLSVSGSNRRLKIQSVTWEQGLVIPCC